MNFKGKIVRKGSIRKGKLREMDQLKRKSCKKRINANLQLGCHGNSDVLQMVTLTFNGIARVPLKNTMNTPFIEKCDQ